MYYLYILKCSDGTLYTGITVDFKAASRGAQHRKTRRQIYQEP